MSPANIYIKGVLYDELAVHKQTFGKVETYHVVITGTSEGFTLRPDDEVLFGRPTDYRHHQEVILDDDRRIVAVANWEILHRGAHRSGVRREREEPRRGPSCV